MKKLFVILFALFALSVHAQATTVTISANQISQLPFNPSGLGSTRTITVSATNGSATVTSSAAFPPNIVGIAGFTISIGGVQYVVASVASTSSLTLTTNYAGVTGSATMLLYPYALLRAYATAGFQDNVTGQNVQAGAPGSGQFYKQVAVSIINSGAGNVAYMPEFTIPSTTDALINNQAQYIFGFYRPDGSLLSFYTCGSVNQLAIQPNTPTTWTAICNFNSPGGVVPPNTEVYTKSQIDQRFPNCSAGQSYYFNVNGNIVSCLNFGSGLTLTGNTLSASGGGGSINSGTIGDLAGYAATGTTLSPFTVGSQLTVTGTTLKTSGVRPAINAVVDYGAVCDGATNTLTALQNAVNAALAAGGGDVVLPATNCRIAGTLTVPGGVRLIGQGQGKTIISSVTNAVIVDAVEGTGAFEFFGPKIYGLSILGSKTAGGNQIGLQVDGGGSWRDVDIQNVDIINAGSHGLYVGLVFSSYFARIYSDDNAGYPFYIVSPNMPSNRFEALYAGAVSAAAPAGFRVRQGRFYCYTCNGINASSAGSAWAIVGDKIGVDGALSNVAAYAKWEDCNIESWRLYGIRHYSNSVSDISGDTSFVGDASASGIAIALLYEIDSALFPWSFPKGKIDSTVGFSQGPASFYANSQPIHGNDLPRLAVDGQGPRISGDSFVSTYYNTTTSRAEQIYRNDGYEPFNLITTTTSFTNPGPRTFIVNCAANCALTLPSADRYTPAEEISIKNISADGVVVTVQSSGSTIDGAGTYTVSLQNESVVLYPYAAGSDWKVLANAPVTPGTAGYYPIYTSTKTIAATGSLIQNSGSAILLQGTTLYGTDNTLDIGSSSDNRPRNIYGATALTVPRVYYGGGNPSATAGSATPEGAVTAEPGSMYLRTNGSWYIKASGSGNTGWTLVSTSGSGCVPGGSAGELLYDDGSGSCDSTTGLISDGVNVTAGSGNFRATRPRFTTSIDDSSGNELLIVTATGSAVNEVTLANAATGNNPTFTASGGDANVGINFVPKGSGTIQVSGVPIVTTTAAQSLTDKTLTASTNVLGGVTMTLGSDADGDMYYRASGVLTRLPKGTALQQLRMNAGATAPEWATISGGGTITGSGSTGTIAKFTGSSAIGDSLLSESGSTVTTAGRQTITGLTINADATNTVASLTANATFTKNNSNPRDFFGVLIKPTFNFGGSNSATIVNILEVDSTNTNVTGLTTNLLSLKYGGNIAFNVDSDGGITFANGIRQAFAPSTIVASLNVGQVAADPSSPVNGDVVYETNTNKFRCYENSAWVNCISSGANTALSNLASVAINTSLLSDTTLTDDLGSASFYWRRAYAGQYFADATISAVSGNQTINKALFSFVIGSGTTNAVITNSFVTTSSLVICTPQKKDATALTVSAEPASGSVTITTNAGATADMPVACIVYNQ